jgi:hypothetical protein
VITRKANNINNIDDNQTVTSNNDVTDEKQHNQLKLHNCHNVTDEKGGMEKDINNNVPKALRGRIDPKLAKEIYE